MVGGVIREKGLKWTLSEEGILLVEAAEGGKRYFVPNKLREEFIKENHDGLLAGHWGLEKTLKRMKEYYCEGMRNEVKEYIESSVTCVLFNPAVIMTPPLKPIETKEPFEMIGIDILEIGQALSGNRRSANTERRIQ